MITEKDIIEEGEKYMMELWHEIGYRIAEDSESYKIFAEFINNKVNKALQSQKQKIIEEIRFLEEIVRNMMLECIRYKGDKLTNSYKLVADRLELLKSLGEKEWEK